MKNRPARSIFIFAFFVACLLAAVPRLQADDFPPLASEDLALKDNPASPGADAMILYRDNVVDATKVREGGDSDEEFFRIKIFTKAGISHADSSKLMGPSGAAARKSSRYCALKPIVIGSPSNSQSPTPSRKFVF
jgi:hypothetical protein